MRSGLDQNNGADLYILKNILNELVWSYTGNHQDEGKYLGCPWWTVEALYLYDTKADKWHKQIVLEHVVERKLIISKLLTAKCQSEIKMILDSGDTCVVTKLQHDALLSGDGWSRYVGLNVVPGPKARKRYSDAMPLAPNLDMDKTKQRCATEAERVAEEIDFVEKVSPVD